MKKLFKSFLLLTASLTLITSCMQDEKPAEGYTTDEVVKMATAVCTWCGDYSLETAGSTHKTDGMSMRICGISDKWDGGCPVRTTLGDGSVWKKKDPSNCSCD